MRRQDKNNQAFQSTDKGLRTIPAKQKQHERKLRRRSVLRMAHLKEARIARAIPQRMMIRKSVYNAIASFLKAKAEEVTTA